MNAKELKALKEEIALLKEKNALLEKLNATGTPKESATKSKPKFEWDTYEKEILRNKEGNPVGYVLKQRKAKAKRILFGGYVRMKENKHNKTEDDGWFPITDEADMGSKKQYKFYAPAKNPCEMTQVQFKAVKF